MTDDVTDPDSLDPATAHVDVVVSALQGGRPVSLDGQVALAESAVRNGVRRFIPSDFAIELFKAPAGAPQFDIRRDADDIIDALPLEVVHELYSIPLTWPVSATSLAPKPPSTRSSTRANASPVRR